jgi:hypothetical protein
MIGSPYLDTGGRYERAMEGWVDSTHPDAFTHTVRLSDGTLTVALSAVCSLPPDYSIRAVRAEIADGPADPALPAALEPLVGVRMVAGFTRRLAEATGAMAGGALFVDAGVELGRLARQVTRVPEGRLAAFDTRDPARCWELDTTGWAELPNSCFAYSPAGRALFGVRPVSTPMTPDLYDPPVGARRVFVRRKLARLVRTGPRLHLFNAMHDNVHGFDVHYEVDLDRGVIAAAGSVVSRLPYAGICSEPQRRIEDMVGLPVDRALRKRIQAVLGGGDGCGQLHDLTADLLKLLALPTEVGGGHPPERG